MLHPNQLEKKKKFRISWYTLINAYLDVLNIIPAAQHINLGQALKQFKINIEQESSCIAAPIC